MDDQDLKTTDEEPRLPYEPPAIEDELEFERAALATCSSCASHAPSPCGINPT